MKCNSCETFLDFHPIYYHAETEYLYLNICYDCHKLTGENPNWELIFNCPMGDKKQ